MLGQPKNEKGSKVGGSRALGGTGALDATRSIRGEMQRTRRVPRRPPGGRRTDGEMTQVGAPTMTPKRSRTEAEDEEEAPIRVEYGGVSQGAAAAAAAT